MNLRKSIAPLFCLGVAAFGAAPLRAQSNCTSSPAAAVECFVANAVATKLAAPRHGLTLAQFQAYGVAVSQILQSHHSYLVLVTTASAVSDAMPPVNADGTLNQAAQTAALTSLVDAEVANGFVSVPQGAALRDLEWFAEDVTASTNINQGYIRLLTPGAAMRLLDSYVIAASSAGAGGAGITVDWQKVETSISTVIDTFTSAGIIRIPPGKTAAQLKALLRAVAGVIFSYKTATGRNAL